MRILSDNHSLSMSLVKFKVAIFLFNCAGSLGFLRANCARSIFYSRRRTRGKRGAS